MITWVVVIVGLAWFPTFHGERSRLDCLRHADHINAAYGTMARATCVPVAEAKRLGYGHERKEGSFSDPNDPR